MLAFLLLAVLPLTWAACPNDCSRHGTCTTASVCQCESGWAGEDCSIPDVALTSGSAVHAAVATKAWQYFHIQAISQMSDLVIEVNQTGISGDCDTYVRLGNYPTRLTFDYRDISSKKQTRITIAQPKGMYYIGVYGFIGGEFDIVAYVKSDCKNDCSNHGVCDSHTSMCTCNSGYAGDDCSIPIISMVNETVYSGVVERGTMNYYSFLGSGNTLIFTVVQTGEASEDCDLYVSSVQIPTLTNFEFRDTTTAKNFSLKVADAKPSVYYLGVYGFQKCSYNIKATATNQCPNQCSGTSHGICPQGTTVCQCEAMFAGSACESMTTMITYDNVYSGYVDENMWNYYNIKPDQSSNVVVSVNQTSPDMDCDLFIRKDENPTRFLFNYRDISAQQNFSITIENPSFSFYYIGVFGYKPCSYSLKVQSSRNCPNSCTNPTHGYCQQGHCICQDGWTGEDCSIPNNLITIGSTLSSTLYAGNWSYYSVAVKADYEVTILMRELDSDGFLWLYESRDPSPSMVLYDYADTESNTATHRIVFKPESDMIAHIGVFASPFTRPDVSYGFKLVVWQASF